MMVSEKDLDKVRMSAGLSSGSRTKENVVKKRGRVNWSVYEECTEDLKSWR